MPVRRFLRFALIAVPCAMLGLACKSGGIRPEDRPVYVEHEVLVGIERGGEREVEELTLRLGAKTAERMPHLNAARIVLPPSVAVPEALVEYRALPLVAYAEPNYWRWIHGDPNDPSYPRQWAVKRIGCENAWTIEQGEPDVVIAIVDSGVDDEHPDLEGALLPGHSVIDQSPNFDELGHGTEMAVVAAARRNNSLGSTGVAPKCSILPVKATDDDGGGTDWDFAWGIDWAKNEGAHVINMSFGAEPYSLFLHAAVISAAGDERLLVSSSGNSGTNTMEYPAAFEEVLAVSGVLQDDERDDDANFGDGWVDVAAPSRGVTATMVDGTETGNMGTSQAAALVSGAAALLYSHLGTGTSSATIRARLEDRADPVQGSGWVAHGRVDVYDSLENEDLPHRESYAPKEVEVEVGESVEGTFRDLQVRDDARYVARSVATADARELRVVVTFAVDYVGDLVELEVGREATFDSVGSFGDALIIDLEIWDFEADAWYDFSTFVVWDDFDSSGAIRTSNDPGRFLGEENEVRVRYGRTWSGFATASYEVGVDQLRVTTIAEK